MGLAKSSLVATPAVPKRELHFVRAVGNLGQSGDVVCSDKDTGYCGCVRLDEEYCGIVTGSVVNCQLPSVQRTRPEEDLSVRHATTGLRTFAQVSCKTGESIVGRGRG